MLAMGQGAVEDWDKLEEDQCNCPNCNQPVRVYWSPTTHRYLLLGFFCHHCDTPYQDLFITQAIH